MRNLPIYIITFLLLGVFASCDEKLDIKQGYSFELQSMPVPKKIKVGETVEIRCHLYREGNYKQAKYYIRYFQPDGQGELRMDNGTVFIPNDLYPLSEETFRLYYTSHAAESHVIDVYIQDNFGQIVQSTFSFSNDSN